MSSADGIECIKSMRLEWKDQLDFARWSGDCNPMHLDPVVARRTHAGAPVVHGVHLLLRSLEALYREAPHTKLLASIRVDFKKYVFVGQSVSLHLRQTSRGLSAELRTAYGPAVVIRFSAEPSVSAAKLPRDLAIIDHSDDPADVNLAAIPHRSGRLIADNTEIARAFPAVAERLSPDGVAALGQASRLVGMVCPGLYSVFSSLEFTIGSAEDRPGLGFSVTTADERTKLVTMAVAGSGLSGTASAFFRPKPVDMPGMKELASRVSAGVFSSRQALVIGGSRGLGEVTAKLIAAGGGRVAITYAAGKADAERVASQINSYIGATVAETYELDVTKELPPQLAQITDLPTHIYYYATPHIFVQKTPAFDAQLFRDFLAYYVDAVSGICEFYARQVRRPIRMLYPSSVAVNERPKGMTEYAMAKVAGELLCDDLAKLYPQIRIAKPRLPRTLTDQTSTIMQTENQDPTSVVSPLLAD